MNPKIFLLIILSVINEVAFSQEGILDSTFGTNGKVTTSLGIGFCGLADIAIQSDGKIVSVGGADVPGPMDFDYAVARYNADGSVDSACVIVAIFAAGPSSATAVVLQPDGKIVFTGNNVNDFGIVRLNIDGTFDTSFSQVFDPFILVNALALQPDGKIVAAGQAAPGNFGLVRYNNDGSLDSSFGDSGVVVTAFANESWVNSIAITPGNKILAGGVIQNGGSGFVMTQYNTSGTLDSSFGNGGIVITPINSPTGITSLALQSDGKIVAAGSSINPNCNWVVARYNSNGSLDNSFGANGVASVELITCGSPSSIVLQADGKIIEAGSSNSGNNSDFALMRFNSNGTLDGTFGSGGKVFTDFDNSTDGISSVAIDPLKRIVAGGSSGGKFALARYLSGLETGIGPVDLQNSVSIFPNPSTGIFQIQITNSVIQSTEAFNLLGEKIFSTSNLKFQTSNSIDLSAQPDGVYFLHLKTTEGMVVKKVAISR